MKKQVSMLRASAAVILGCAYTAISMYMLGKSLLLAQAQAYQNEIDTLKAQLPNEEG